ncbi:MAG: hypothetical protein ACOCQD_05325, partial [archaeon]
MPYRNAAIQGAKYVKYGGGFLSKTFGFIFKYFSWFFVIAFIMINAVYIGATESPDEGLIYAGEHAFSPTKTIYTQSNEIIERGGVFEEDAGFFENIWNFLDPTLNYFTAILTVWIWFNFLGFVFSHSIFDTSQWFKSRFLAVIFFILMQEMYLLLTAAFMGVNGMSKTELLS